MTTTVPAKGPALPVRTDTSGQTIGQKAWRVYAFKDAASAVAAGFSAEGGGATSVYVVSQSELDNGKFILDGDPVAQAVYTAPTTIPLGGPYKIEAYPVEGGLSQAIFLVGGSLT